MSDTDFMNADGTGTASDPTFEEMQKLAEQIDESEEQVGRPPLPRNDFHVGYLVSQEYREAFDEKLATVRVGIKVTESIPDAVGKVYYGDLFLESSAEVPVAKGSKERRPATAEERTKNDSRIIATCKRFARVLGLSTVLPKRRDQEGISEWLDLVIEQKADGPQVIFTGYSDKNGFSKIQFDSLRAFEDPGKDPKTRKPNGKSAIETAREFNAKAGGGSAEPVDSGY